MSRYEHVPKKIKGKKTQSVFTSSDYGDRRLERARSEKVTLYSKPASSIVVCGNKLYVSVNGYIIQVRCSGCEIATAVLLII